MSKLYHSEKLDLRRYQEFEELYKKSMRITSKQILEIKDPLIRQQAEGLLTKILLSLTQLEEDVKKLEGNEIKRVGSDVQS
jgi:hypothetical protein